MTEESGKHRSIVKRLVTFVDVRGGIADIHGVKLASSLDCHPNSIYRAIAYLKEQNVLTQMSFGGNSKGEKWALNEKMIEAGEYIVEHLLKYSTGGSPINVSTFAKTRSMSVALMGITLDEFCKLGVVSVKPNHGSSPNYFLEEKNDTVWKELWQPKLKFPDSENETIAKSDSLPVGEKFIDFIKSKGGYVEMGTAELANVLDCTKSGVLYAVERLEKRGMIVVKQRTKRGDRYNTKGIYALTGHTEDKQETVIAPSSVEPLDVQLNKALKDKILAQEQAIKFGRTLEQANIKIKELELKIEEMQTSGVRKENFDLSSVANRNHDELERLSKSVSA